MSMEQLLVRNMHLTYTATRGNNLSLCPSPVPMLYVT